MAGQQVFVRFGGAALGQAEAAAAAQVNQVGELFGASLGHLAGVRVGRAGRGAAAELVDPGGPGWFLAGRPGQRAGYRRKRWSGLFSWKAKPSTSMASSG